MSELFISHSSRDNAAARELQARLEEQGHRSVFLDLDPEKGIQTGVSWERTLYTKLRSCRAVVALCSDSYLASQWCFAEIALARMEGKELFVLQIDPWSETTQMPSILTEEQFVDLRTNQDDGYQRLWNGFEAKGIVAAEHCQWIPGKSPYPGLRAFEEEDAPILFGRDDEIREGVELLNRVRRQGHPRLVMVLGSSGSGKSSLTRAGIVPQLRRDKERWLVVGPFRPGAWLPARELALALSKAFNEAGKPRPWEEILERLDASALESAGTNVAPAGRDQTSEQRLSAREMLSEALRKMEGELGADDSQVVESVQRLMQYLESAPATTPSVRSARSIDTSANALAALATELRYDSELPDAKVVLVIDQFEELLGREDEGEDDPTNRFLRLLKGGIEAEDNPPLALGTMRSDFLGVLQRSGSLQGVGFKSLSVGPMSDEGMLKVIEQPATLGQIDLEKPELTQRLLRETGTSDALPLLAFTLRAMWEHYHETRRFDVRGYEALGGLHGAIAQVADDTLDAALANSEAGTEKELRIAFLSLARPAAEGSGWARQPASLDEMPERVQPMIQQFIKQRLLVKRADGTVEVAHEALFRSWEKLRGWLNANAEGLYLLREIRRDAENWEGVESDAEKKPYLWRGGRLARALELRDRGVLKLTPLDTSFIDESDNERKKEAAEKEARRKAELEQARQLAEEQTRSARRTRKFAAVVLVALVGVVVLAFVAWSAQQAAEEQARIAASRALAVQSLASFAEAADLSMLLSVEAFRTYDTLAARSSMLSILNRVSSLQAFLVPHRQLGSEARLLRVGGIAFYGEGDTVAVSSRERGLILIDPRTGKAGGPNLGTDGGGITSVAFSPQSGRLAWADESGAVIIHRSRAPAGEADILPVLDEAGSIHDIAFDPTGQTLAVALGSGSVHVQDVETQSRVDLAPHTDKPGGATQAVAFSPHGSILAAGSYARDGNDGTVRLWQMPEGRTVGQALVSRPASSGLTGDGSVNDVAFNRDGSLLAWSVGNGVVLWDLEKAELHHVLKVNSTERLTGLAFSSAGSPVLAAGSKSGAIWRWDVESRESLGEPLRVHSRWVESLAFSPDGKALLSLNEDDSVIRWDLGSTYLKPGLQGSSPLVRPLVTPFAHTVNALAFSPPDGSLVAARDGRKGLAVWDQRSGERVFHSGTIPLSPASTGELLAFSPDGKRLAVGTKDGKVLILNIARGQPVDELEVEHSSPVLALAFSSRAGLLASGDKHGVLVMTEAATGKRVWHKKAHEDEVSALAFSPDGLVLASSAYKSSADMSSDKGAIALRDVSTGALIRKLPAHPEGAVDLAFSAGGKLLASVGGEDNALLLWDVDGGDEPKRRIDTGSPVWSVAFDDRGSMLATANEDHVALFDATSLHRLGKLGGESGEPVMVVAFSPGGTTLASSLGSEVVLWDLRFEAWAKQLCRRANRDLTEKELLQYNVDRRKTGLWINIKSWFSDRPIADAFLCMKFK